MKRHTEDLPKRILEIQAEVVKDLELNDFLLHDKAMKCPGIKAKWLAILFEEESYMKKLENAYEQLVEDYVEAHGKRGIPKFKAEGEARMDGDIMKLGSAIKSQKEVVRYMDGIYKIITSFGYEIKNATDIMKMEQ